MMGGVTRGRVVAARPYRWDLLPKIGRGAAQVARAAAAAIAPHRPEAEAWRAATEALGAVLGGEAPAIAAGPVVAFAARELPARLAGTPWVAARIRRVDGRGFAVVLDGALAARAAARALGADGDGELAAPRGATAAEKGVLGFLVAAALAARGARDLLVDGVVDDPAALAPLFPDPWVLAVDATCRLGATSGLLRLWAPESLVCAPAPAGARPWARLERVDLLVPAVAGGACLARREVAGLAPRDVVVLDGAARGRVRLACGRGGFAASVSPGALTITEPYQQGAIMTRPPDEALAGELPVELSCQLARVSMTARELLELGPGAVIPLGTPLGTQAELCAGGKVIARGELVDVDGELGFRVLSI